MPAVALVTGGSRGIGRAVAAALAARGFSVGLVARDPAALEATAAEIRAAGVRAAALPCDLRAPDAAARVLEQCAARLGPAEAIVHAAGTAPTARIAKTSDAMLDEVLDLHVRVPLRLARAALPALLAAGRGTLVQIASTAGLRGFPFTSAYVAGKHAMVGLARAFDVELRDSGVVSYAVCPGFVDTDITRTAAQAAAARGSRSEAEVLATFAAMNRIGRLLRPEEVGAAVARLCSERPEGCVLDLDSEPPRLD